MVCQLVACYEGCKSGNLKDKATGREIYYQHLKITSIDDDSNGFDDMVLSVPYDMDLSHLVRKHTYVFNILLPQIQRDNMKFRCVGVLPFEVNSK